MRSFIPAVAVLTLTVVASSGAVAGSAPSFLPTTTTHSADVISGRVHLRTRAVSFFHRAAPVRSGKSSNR